MGTTISSLFRNQSDNDDKHYDDLIFQFDNPLGNISVLKDCFDSTLKQISSASSLIQSSSEESNTIIYKCKPYQTFSLVSPSSSLSSSSLIYANHCQILSKSIVFGSDNLILTDDCIVIGDRNQIWGKNTLCIGSFNWIGGSRCIGYGWETSLTGSMGTWYGTLQKSSFESLIQLNNKIIQPSKQILSSFNSKEYKSNVACQVKNWIIKEITNQKEQDIDFYPPTKKKKKEINIIIPRRSIRLSASLSTSSTLQKDKYKDVNNKIIIVNSDLKSMKNRIRRKYKNLFANGGSKNA